MRFFCIADTESSLGFKLTGVETRDVASRSQALEALQEAKGNKEIGIILVTEKAAALVREEVQTHIEGSPVPLILEIPSRGLQPKRKSAAELLKELAGF